MTPKETATANGDGLTERVSVALDPSEKRVLKKAAFLSDESVSSFIRAAAVKAAQRVARQALRGLDRAA